MPRTEVHKFGGTSVGSVDHMQGIARLLAEPASQGQVVVVASAMAGTTDDLVAAGEAAARGDREAGLAAVERVRTRHAEALAQLGDDDHQVGDALVALMLELRELVQAVVYLRELTPRVRDRLLAVGEKLSVRLLSRALRSAELQAEPVDADTFLETDGRFGEATPLAEIADRTMGAALQRRLEAGVIPVVTGFCGRAPDGATTTLGRGGSDFTATLVAGCLRADEVTIWTDVDGVFTSDPRVVPEARVIGQLNYREAAEMSYYGAKVLHQRTMIPVERARIPVRIRNTLNPEAPGTVVDGRFTPGSHPAKAITAIRSHALVSVEGKGMAGVPGIAARLFQALADHGTSVTMISQSSSESSISLAVPSDEAKQAKVVLEQAFRPDLARGDVEEVVVRDGIGIVAVVGLGMAKTPGVAGRVFRSLGEHGVNVLAIAQGSSELNISLALDHGEIEAAIRAMHAEFGLHRLDTGEDDGRRQDLLLLGCGNIGRALAELVLDRRTHVFERFGLDPRIVAIADRSGYVFEPTGLSLQRLREIMDAKSGGRPLGDLPQATRSDSPGAMVRHALDYRLARPVLVDVSDAAAGYDALLEALQRGCDGVTANKKPLSGPMEGYSNLRRIARDQGRIVRAEATVGAGLPVVDTLEMLLATGDKLQRATGALSGTLGYLMTQIEGGMAFSEAVSVAVEQGYTEPDPVADLSGEDVARKALILGRLSGLVEDDVEVELEPLVDPKWAGTPVPELLSRLTELDADMSNRAIQAREEGCVLRYVAEVAPGRVQVGLRPVPAASPLGGLSGTDNMIVFESERYASRPLVVSGPGAGIEVTAMGVFGDVLRIAAERR